MGNVFINPNFHVILVHLPLGVFLLGVLIELLSFMYRRSTLSVAGRWMVLLGALHIGETACAFVHDCAHRNDRKPGVELHRRHGVTGVGPEERLLEARMRDRFRGANEAGAQLNPRRTHLKIRRDRFAAADPAGDEDRHFGDDRQDFLRQYRG